MTFITNITKELKKLHNHNENKKKEQSYIINKFDNFSNKNNKNFLLTTHHNDNIKNINQI